MSVADRSRRHRGLLVRLVGSRRVANRSRHITAAKTAHRHDEVDPEHHNEDSRARKRSHRAETPADSEDDDSSVDSDYAEPDGDDPNEGDDEDENDPAPISPSQPRASTSGSHGTDDLTSIARPAALQIGDSWASKEDAYAGVRGAAAEAEPAFQVSVQDSRTEGAAIPGRPAFAIMACAYRTRGCTWRLRLTIVDGRWCAFDLARLR